jgi:hypothetical protein|tara:strand:+ start:378 stop:632 length:255 start_codon:yes stop_codon:yes gene_type:complete
MLSKEEREALIFAQEVLQQQIKDWKRDLVRFEDAGDRVQTRLLNNWIDEHQKSSDGLTQLLSWSSVREYNDVVGDAFKNEEERR